MVHHHRPHPSKAVSFSEDVIIWSHEVTIGDNPSCTIGTPVTLDWKRCQEEPLHLALQQLVAEQERRYAAAITERRRRRRKGEPAPHGPPCGRLNYYQRQDLLKEAGFSEEQLKLSERSIKIDKSLRAWSRRETLPIRSTERLQVVFHKLLTGEGSARRKRQIVKEWHKCYNVN